MGSIIMFWGGMLRGLKSGDCISRRLWRGAQSPLQQEKRVAVNEGGEVPRVPVEVPGLALGSPNGSVCSAVAGGLRIGRDCRSVISRAMLSIAEVDTKFYLGLSTITQSGSRSSFSSNLILSSSICSCLVSDTCGLYQL